MASWVSELDNHVLIWTIGYLPTLIADTPESNKLFLDSSIEELCDAKVELAMREFDDYDCFVKTGGKPQTREGKRAEKRVGKRAERSRK